MADREPAKTTWHVIEKSPSAGLVDGRLQLHWAAQIPASIGHTYYTPRSDYGHTSLVWNAKENALMSNAVGDDLIVAGLRLSDLTLVLLNRDTDYRDTFDLSGKTVQDGYDWLETSINLHLANEKPVRKPLSKASHEMPDHALAEGATFDINVAALDELHRWYSNADELLQVVKGENAGASKVRCWPHHFDIATLIEFDEDKDAETNRSIGVGFSPGDGGFAEPYWYALPWPAPKSEILPALATRGSWHTDGWVGAILDSKAIRSEDGTAQHGVVADFVRGAIVASKLVLGL